jgi:acetylglutamate kinase
VVLLKLVGMNPVVVHGGGPQIENLLARVGKKGRIRAGHARHRCRNHGRGGNGARRPGEQGNRQPHQPARRQGGRLTGKDGNFIRAKKLMMENKEKPGDLLDIGQVGEIVSIDPSLIALLDTGAFIPVIAPIGVGSEGETYNINADVVAGKIAEVLKAEKLVLLTNTPGVLDKAGNLLTGITPQANRRHGGRWHIVRRHAAQDRLGARCSAQRREKRAYHRRPCRTRLLLEILTDEGVGTLIKVKISQITGLVQWL